jgi:hypothetical protein
LKSFIKTLSRFLTTRSFKLDGEKSNQNCCEGRLSTASATFFLTWRFTIFAALAIERFSKISMRPGLLRGTAEKCSIVGGAKIVNAQIRRSVVSKAQGEAIPHGTMRGTVFYRGVTKVFLTVPIGLIFSSMKTARSDEHLESNKKKCWKIGQNWAEDSRCAVELH